MNQDIRTQLLSESLRKMMEKFSNEGNRIATALLKLNRHGYFQDSTRNVTINKAKEMTYCPAGKPTILGDTFRWLPKSRQVGKYGKVIRKLLDEQIPRMKVLDTEVEDLVNRIKSELDEGIIYEVSGEDIRYWYLEDNYHKSNFDLKTTLASSCMRYEHCQHYLDIYVKNEIVKMVVCVKEDKLIGRALLWENKWMDRIYGADHVVSRFKSYARKNNYYHKVSQNASDRTSWVSPNGDEEDIELVLYMETDFGYYPYMDTFFRMDDTGLSNNCYWGSYELTDTGGGYDRGDGYVWDDVDDCEILEEDSVYVESRGITTHCDNCEYDSNRGEYILKEDAVHVKYKDDYFHRDDCTYCDGIDEWVLDCEVDTFTCEYSNGIYPMWDDILIIVDDHYYIAEENLDSWCEENDYHFIGELGEYKSAEWLTVNDFYQVDCGEWVSVEILESTPTEYEYDHSNDSWSKIKN